MAVGKSVSATVLIKGLVRLTVVEIKHEQTFPFPWLVHDLRIGISIARVR